MATTVKDKITVSELSKYGFKAGNEYVNYSKQLPESDKSQVVPGASLDVELYVADSGKRYLNKILSFVPSKPIEVLTDSKATTPVVDTERAKKFVPKYQKTETKASEGMSKSEWQAKDRSQLIGGLSHDAAAITAALVNTTSLDSATALVTYKELLEGMLRIRDEVK